MSDKFSIEELLIRVMPGGLFLTALYYLYGQDIDITLNQNFDFLYTFVFFCLSFILGELLQTLTHSFEWLIDIFFKFRRPSEIFLYSKNPVLKSQHKRLELISFLNLSTEEMNVFNMEYSKLPFVLFWKISKSDNAISQSIFWKLYTEVSGTDEMKISNRNYLFVRVIMIEFLLLSGLLLIENKLNISVLCIMVFLIFLWRSRGCARGLVFKTVLLNLKNKNEKDCNF